jgi:hypothetical protein
LLLLVSWHRRPWMVRESLNIWEFHSKKTLLIRVRNVVDVSHRVLKLEPM